MLYFLTLGSFCAVLMPLKLLKLMTQLHVFQGIGNGVKNLSEKKGKIPRFEVAQLKYGCIFASALRDNKRPLCCEL